MLAETASRTCIFRRRCVKPALSLSNTHDTLVAGQREAERADTDIILKKEEKWRDFCCPASLLTALT